MKGIMSIIELMITALILFIAFIHFFPQYTIRSKWDSILLSTKVRDVSNTIDRLEKTYYFATELDEFDNFMNNALLPEKTGTVMVWWRSVDGINTPEDRIPYFTEAYRESMVDAGLFPHEFSVDSNTVALWHLNENIGITANDESSNNNDGTLINMENEDWIKSILSNGLNFDGVDEYVEVADDSSLDLQQFTIEAWIKPFKNNIASFGPTLIMREDTSGNNVFLMRAGINKTDVGFISCEWDPNPNHWRVEYPFEEGKWYFVVCVKDLTNRRIYVNTQFIGENGWNDNIDYTNADQLFIGMDMDNGGPSDYFNGTIDEIRILDKALNEDEIWNDYGKYEVYSFTLGLGYTF